MFKGGVNTWIPKPKTFVGSVVSFDVGVSRHTAGMVKALALISNSTCVPVMFSYLAGLYRMHKANANAQEIKDAQKVYEKASWNYFVEGHTELTSMTLEEQYRHLHREHDLWRVSVVIDSVMKAFQRETKMSPDKQVAYCAAFAAAEGGKLPTARCHSLGVECVNLGGASPDSPRRFWPASTPGDKWRRRRPCAHVTR